MLFLRRYIILFLLLFVCSLEATTAQNDIIKIAIKNKFLESYPTLSISQIMIKPLGKTPKNFQNYQIDTIFLSHASLKRNHGTFSILYSNGKKNKKRFFKFHLDATIGVYISQRNIKRAQALSNNSLFYSEIAFKNLPTNPITEKYLYDYETKRSIKEGKIITVNDVRRILDIKRGTLVDATLYDGAVVLTFKVKAIEEGNIGDIIKVKRGHYKKFNALITSKNSVDIIE